MKKLIFTALVALFMGATAFANNGNPVTEKVNDAFKASFLGASNVQWSQVPDYDLYRAVFTYNNEQLTAFLNDEGEVLAITRYVAVKDLPLAISRSVAAEYKGYLVSPSIIEYNSNGETAYHLTLLGEKQDIVIKATAGGMLSVQKKVKK